jgi:hypothetical protein
VRGWLAAKVGQELVMTSVENGTYIGLDEVDTRMAYATLDRAVRTVWGLAEEYAVMVEATLAEVGSFLVELEQRGVISVAVEPSRADGHG